MRNFDISGVHWKIWLLGGGGGVSRKTNTEGGLPEGEVFNSFQI